MYPRFMNKKLTLILLSSLILTTSCEFLKTHPEVVKEAEHILEETSEVALESII